MDYTIVIDSCGELTEDMKKDPHIIPVPLTMQIEDETFVDDETFNQGEFLKKAAEAESCPKSACPSPGFFKRGYEQAQKRAYAVTLSAELSGSCNSAVLARDLMLEEGSDLKIHVFNSRSASVGETLIAEKIQECEAAGMPFEEVVDTVEDYISGQNTYFVLEDLDTLRKNGRLSGVRAILASALKIKPVMGATENGTIIQLDQARGINKALMKMVDYIVTQAEKPEKKTLALSQCNCPERARLVADAIKKRLPVRNVILLDTGGISTMYANDGGIIAVL